MAVSAGTRLGPYEVVDSIGAGGMGEVWRAKDTRLDREVAIKILPPGFSQNDQFLQRFEGPWVPELRFSDRLRRVYSWWSPLP